MTINSLLPPNATKLERALEESMRPDSDVTDAIDLIRTAKENPPDDWVMWLVWEYGLDELLPYLPDPSVVLENGLQWQPIRGTPGSIKLAFGWLGIATAIEEEDPDTVHWYEFQLWPSTADGTLYAEDETELLCEDGTPLAYESDPCYVPTRTQLANMVGLARLSAPVGTRLSRLHNCYDLRRAVYDECNWDDGSLYDADSGVYDESLDVILSFGRDTAALLDVSETWNPTYYSVITRQVAGQGIGRSILLADGGTIASDGERANGTRVELPQFALVHTRKTLAEESLRWGDVGWGDRDWDSPATEF